MLSYCFNKKCMFLTYSVESNHPKVLFKENNMNLGENIFHLLKTLFKTLSKNNYAICIYGIYFTNRIFFGIVPWKSILTYIFIYYVTRLEIFNTTSDVECTIKAKQFRLRKAMLAGEQIDFPGMIKNEMFKFSEFVPIDKPLSQLPFVCSNLICYYLMNELTGTHITFFFLNKSLYINGIPSKQTKRNKSDFIDYCLTKNKMIYYKDQMKWFCDVSLSQLDSESIDVLCKNLICEDSTEIKNELSNYLDINNKYKQLCKSKVDKDSEWIDLLYSIAIYISNLRILQPKISHHIKNFNSFEERKDIFCKFDNILEFDIG